MEDYLCFNLKYLIVSLYKAIFNNGCAEQQACKIPENLIVNSCNLVHTTSNTSLNVGSLHHFALPFLICRPPCACLLPCGHKMACCPSKLHVCTRQEEGKGVKAKVTCQFLKNTYPKLHPVASVNNLLARIVSHVPRLKTAKQKGTMDEGWAGQPNGSAITFKIYLWNSNIQDSMLCSAQ